MAMNLLPRITLKQFLRYTETVAAPITKLIGEQLTNRSLVRVHGVEVVPFLQGLITNDMNHLHRDGHPSMFTMFLNNTGRIMYDAIIYKTPNPNTYLIECDKQISSELRRQLRLFRVRKKIDIDCISSDYCPWAVFSTSKNAGGLQMNPMEANSRPGDLLVTPDPRVQALGVRVIQPKNRPIKDLQKLFYDSEVIAPSKVDYSAHRYSYGVGEGVIDHPPGKCFPLEANGDFLHGISFQKGCYIGQELTARVYHTGVVRKRLMPLELSSDVDEGVTNVQTQAGSVVGTLRGISKRRGLALLRVEQALKTENLMIDGDLCKTFKPHWWPPEIVSRPRRI